ncbi:hypothetical protein RB195_024402 [Necator americanus]|uniref:Uncharacterized protein n=1 Tax=Necator americanus TaxID=51031 RepID=A0ABR1EN54_NECAM
MVQGDTRCIEQLLGHLVQGLLIRNIRTSPTPHPPRKVKSTHSFGRRHSHCRQECSTWAMAFSHHNHYPPQQNQHTQISIANGHELQRSINQLHPLEISAKEDLRPKKSRQQLQPTRIQPPRAAKRVRFALGTKQA